MEKKTEQKLCRCGKEIKQTYIPPQYADGRRLPLTDMWVSDYVCVSCRSAVDKEEKEKEVALRFVSAGIFPKQHTMRFENYEGNEDIVKMLLEFVTIHPVNVYLHGNCGLGKTHLLSALVNECIKEKQSVKYYRITDFLNRIRSIMIDKSSEQADEFIENLIKSKKTILLLDDIGVEKVTDVVLEKLYNFFDLIELYERTGVIVTSNLNLQQLAERLSDRIASRIAGCFKIKQLKGGDNRIVSRKSKYNKTEENL